VETQNIILFSISNFGYDLKVIAIQVGITSHNLPEQGI